MPPKDSNLLLTSFKGWRPDLPVKGQYVGPTDGIRTRTSQIESLVA